MVSRVARHMLETLGGLVALSSLPNTGSAQSEPARPDETGRVAEDIRAALEADGPRSAALIDPLTELAVLYEAEGEHALATAALEEELFALAERHPDDLRTVTIHRSIGARRMNVLGRFLAAEYPTEIYGESGFFSFSRENVIAQLVSEAQVHYADAAAVILRNRLYSSDELRDLEMEIVRANDLFRQRSRPKPGSISLGQASASLGQESRDFTSATSGNLRTPDKNRAAYQVGRESYARIISYDEMAFGESADQTALRSRLQAYLQLADWDLLYSENGVALDQYARVHGLLTTTDFAEPLIAELFAPPVPIVLPTFLPNPLETPASARYIDVAFEVTRFGESRRVEILGAAPNVSDAAKDDLVSLIKANRFRPRVTDGELARASPVVVRYYLNN